MEKLEEVRNRCLTKSVRVIQKSWRRHKKRIERRRDTAAVIIQSVWRGWRARIDFQGIHKAAKVIQRHVKRYFALKRLQEERKVKLKSDTSLEEFFDETFPEENSALKDYAPLIFPTSSLPRSFSPAEIASRHSGFLFSLASRAGAVGSWFEPLTEKPVQCSPQNYFWAPCSASSGQMTFNFTRGHVSPLALLMCNFSLAKPRVYDADKLSLTMMSVNKSSAIISRRDVEKIPVAFHCKGTPLPHANRRPHSATTTITGLAAISELDCNIESA